MSYYMAGGYYMAGQLWDTLGSAFESGSMAELPAQGTYAQQSARDSGTNPGYIVPRSWGGTGPGAAVMPPYGRRHYRRMNVTNVHALRRSMRRVQGFAHLARKLMTFTTHHKMKKHRRK